MEPIPTPGEAFALNGLRIDTRPVALMVADGQDSGKSSTSTGFVLNPFAVGGQGTGQEMPSPSVVPSTTAVDDVDWLDMLTSETGFNPSAAGAEGSGGLGQKMPGNANALTTDDLDFPVLDFPVLEQDLTSLLFTLV